MDTSFRGILRAVLLEIMLLLKLILLSLLLLLHLLLLFLPLLPNQLRDCRRFAHTTLPRNPRNQWSRVRIHARYLDQIVPCFVTWRRRGGKRNSRHAICTVTAAPTAGVVVDSPSDHVPIRVLVGPKGDGYSQLMGIDDVSPNHDCSIGGPQRPVIVHATVAGMAIVHAAAPTASASAANAAPSLVHRYPLYGVPIIRAIPPQLVVRHRLNVLVQPQLARAGRYLHPLQAAVNTLHKPFARWALTIQELLLPVPTASSEGC